MTAYISSFPDEVTQPAATSQNVTYSISDELPVFNNEEEIPVFEDEEILAAYLEEQFIARRF